MPNLRRVEDVGGELVLEASNGKVFQQSAAARLARASSLPTVRRQVETDSWVRDQLVAALGPEMIDLETLVLGVDVATGRMTRLELYSDRASAAEARSRPADTEEPSRGRA